MTAPIFQNDAASNAPHTLTAMVSDGTASVSQTFGWTVNYVGVINPAGDAGVQPYAPTYQQGMGDLKTWHFTNS